MQVKEEIHIWINGNLKIMTPEGVEEKRIENAFKRIEEIKKYFEVEKMSTLLQFMELSCKYYDPQQIELKVIQSMCKLLNKRVLDVGCGTGRITFLIAPLVRKVFAVDINEEFINYCKEKIKNTAIKNKVELKVSDARKLPFPDEYFDIILYPWVLSEIWIISSKELKKALEEGYRTLKKGGSMITIDGASGSEYGNILLKFLPKEYPRADDYINDLKNLLFQIFNSIEKNEWYKIPYIFPDPETAYKVIEMDLNLRKIPLDEVKKSELKSELVKHKKKNKVIINESVIFHLCKKGE